MKDRPPNIVIIFTDDQGYADISVYGAQGFQTPNLDRLANEGIRFTDFQVSQAVCSASRAALLTGCYSERVGVQGAFNHTARVGLNPDEETIAEMLKSIGYVTGIFGKWHLGHHKKFLPLQQGFDEYLGIPYSNDMWPVDYDGSFVSGTDHFKSFYPQLPLIEDNEKIEEIRTLDDQDQLTTRYTERAVDFITNNKDRPFFLYLPHSMPHVPLGVSEKFKSKSEQGMYGDVIMEIDWSVGEILNALSDNDLDDNTVVIFTSDNGPWLNYGNHAGSAFPLREGKGTMWEGGSRVPCIIRWPGRITAGSVSHQLAATIDILPTIASITGAALPARPIDGVSIQAILEGDTSATPREEYYYYYGGELIAVRKGKMKLVFPHSYRSYAGIEPGLDGYPGIYKGVLGKYAVGKSKLELYDLDNDISESQDVSEMYPDVVKTLQVLGQKAREELGDRLTGTIGTGVRPIGRLDPERPPSYLEVSHKAVNRPVTIKNQYSEKYSAGGDNGVVNGIRGTIDFHDGNWQGYEGVDFEAIIDLGETSVLSEISSSFLQNQSAWIFFPTEVEFEISADGFDYRSVKRFQHKTEISPGHEVIDFSHIFFQEKVRFVKVKAKNVTICPDWHPGAGGEAWIFVDEIVVK
ncbi:MAG: sulfatase-like hydrolase/transferase [Candidatus Marinimicrobia bacterium]|nr:sulfatase-like hydrolase/transferase [Candidatus Neomarinimicrobiota bacterium]